MKHSQQQVAVATVLIGVLALSACATPRGNSVSDAGGPAGSAIVLAVTQDEATWSMPLDAYRLGDLTRANYAEQLAVQPCIQENGYDWPVPWQDLTEDTTPTLNSSGKRLLSVENAKQWGYHNGSVTTDSTQAWDEFLKVARSLTEDAAFNKIFDTCFDAVRASNPLPSMDDQVWVVGLSAEAASYASPDPAVVAAGAAWQSCMTAAGYGDIPANPDELLTDELMAKFGLQDAPLDASTHTAVQISSEEIALATTDAECSDSSRYNAALYDAQWTIEEQTVKDNQERLTAIAEDVDLYEAGIQTLLDTYYTPTAP